MMSSSSSSEEKSSPGEVLNKSIITWQKENCFIRETLATLRSQLIEQLDQRLQNLGEGQQYSEEELAVRTQYVAELKQLLANQNDAASVAKISEGSQSFRKSRNDLAYLLLRQGENFIYKYHVENHLAYRPEVYKDLIEGLSRCEIRLVDQGNPFEFEIVGDVGVSAEFLFSAASASKTYLGSPEAQYQIGRLYRLGAFEQLYDEEDVQSAEGFDYRAFRNLQAVTFYGKASQRNHPDALTKLGKMHLYGEGVEKNIPTAISFFERAIGPYFCSNTCEALTYVFDLVEQADATALAYFEIKIKFHQQKILEGFARLIELIQANENTLEAALAVEGEEIINHLLQLKYFAEDGETDWNYRLGGFAIAKKFLLETYKKLSDRCKAQHLPDYFAQAAVSLEKLYQLQALDDAIENDNPVELAHWLQVMNLDVNYDDGSPLICRAAKAGSVKVVTYLIAHEVNVHGVDALSKENALVQVCHLPRCKPRKEERLEIARKLIAADLDPLAGKDKEYTALHWAALSEFDEMVQMLLETYHVPVDIGDSLGRSPLNLLLEQHKNKTSKSTLKILLDAGADIHATDQIGCSAWSIVCLYCEELKPLLMLYESEPGRKKELTGFQKGQISLNRMMAQHAVLFKNGGPTAKQCSDQAFDYSEDEVEDRKDQVLGSSSIPPPRK